MPADQRSVCPSMPGEPVDHPKSPLRGTNPGKPHKADMGRKKRNEVIKKKGFQGILLAHVNFLPFDGSSPASLRGSFCLCHPDGSGRGLEKHALSGGDPEGKSSCVFSSLGRWFSRLRWLRWSKGDALPPGVMKGSGSIHQLGNRPAWVRCCSTPWSSRPTPMAQTRFFASWWKPTPRMRLGNHKSGHRRHQIAFSSRALHRAR